MFLYATKSTTVINLENLVMKKTEKLQLEHYIFLPWGLKRNVIRSLCHDRIK